MKTIHVAEMLSRGGRHGQAESPDGNFSVQFAPEEAAENITPEHLFAAAYAACFHSAIKNAAEHANLELAGSTVTARVQLIEDDSGGYELGIELRANLPGIPEAQANELLEQANETCPYSKAVRSNVDLILALD